MILVLCIWSQLIWLSDTSTPVQEHGRQRGLSSFGLWNDKCLILTRITVQLLTILIIFAYYEDEPHSAARCHIHVPLINSFRAASCHDLSAERIISCVHKGTGISYKKILKMKLKFIEKKKKKKKKIITFWCLFSIISDNAWILTAERIISLKKIK